MAIQSENDNNQQAEPRAQQAAPAAAQAQRGQRGTWSFHQQNITNSPVAAGIGGEYFTKMRASLIEIYKDLADGIQLEVLSLNRQNFPALKFSALIVAARMPDVNKSVVTFHTLLLEGTGEKLPSVMRQVDNQNIQVHRVTGDAYDSIMYKQAFEAVQAQYPGVHVIGADACVIPSRVQADNKEVLENIARNAALACVSVINTASDSFGELNLAYMDRDCRFVIDVAFGNHLVYDVLGMPQRSSVLINYSSQKKTGNSMINLDTVNVQDSVATICELSGFVNTIWAPVDQNNNFGFAAYQDPNVPRATQKFAAEFVITSVRTEHATSPAAVLLALSSALSIVDNDAWMQFYLPRPGSAASRTSDRVDITDIGALNVTANLSNEGDRNGFGTPIDMTPIKNDLMEVNRYLISIFRRGIILSIDCPEVGASSWYMSPFAAAASGDQGAYNQIYDAAMELTNGNFARFFERGEPMFTNVVRIPLGHYVVNDQIQDIRNIDYTAICNIFGQTNPQVIHDYSLTFTEQPGRSAVRNLAIREGILREALGQQCTIDGYAARVSIAEKFVRALSASIAECNLPVQVNTPLNADQLRIGTPTPGFVQQSLANGTHTFSSGYGAAARPGAGYRFQQWRG